MTVTLARIAAPLQALLRGIYPQTCLCCDSWVVERQALCADCWADMPFVRGLACDACATPLPGVGEVGLRALCDPCLRALPPWDRGRAVARYGGCARQLVLGLKHADRLDQAPAMGRWMAQAAQDLITPDMLVVPIPLHWRRLWRRRGNQAALLGAHLAKVAGVQSLPDLLVRPKPTASLDHLPATARQEVLADAFRLNPRQRAKAEGRPILLVDDVMTSGATLRAAVAALQALQPPQICVTIFARTTLEDRP